MATKLLTRFSLSCLFAVAACTTETTDASSNAEFATAARPLLSGFGVADAMDIAESGLGFSYFWGGGCWRKGAPHGDCKGSCPSCDHDGNWGADCSGYVAKVWQVPNRSDTDECRHPYSTDDFYNTERDWKNIGRGHLERGDALVYRSAGAGHIFIYGSGDSWGWMKAYEAKGCSYGIVHDSRTAGTEYKAIRRDGF